jgi:hypothetical protein
MATTGTTLLSISPMFDTIVMSILSSFLSFNLNRSHPNIQQHLLVDISDIGNHRDFPLTSEPYKASGPCCIGYQPYTRSGGLILRFELFAGRGADSSASPCRVVPLTKKLPAEQRTINGRRVANTMLNPLILASRTVSL